ncbi:hypothetical protein HHI36_023082 [Cryptolaemus montrouzieri]|uniref:Uncharacterized protein n=1 Tax=Cryptolaemus montrouzieri TaxID=559131 RepID=A0ABD2PF94_9CUCU
MDREELERRRIMAVLEESDSDVMPSDQESGEDDDHVSERSEATNTEQEISDDDEVPLATIRRRVQSEANLHQEEYASTSLSIRDCEITRQCFGLRKNDAHIKHDAAHRNKIDIFRRQPCGEIVVTRTTNQVKV